MTKRKRPEDKLKTGRPLEYTKAIGDHICELVASTDHGLSKLTRLYPELPNKMTINRWRHRVPAFRDQYALAKMEQADLLAEECLEIADDDSQDVKINSEGHEIINSEFVARSRLRIDTRKWLAAKLLPRQYGKGVDENQSVSDKIVEAIIDKLID